MVAQIRGTPSLRQAAIGNVLWVVRIYKHCMSCDHSRLWFFLIVGLHRGGKQSYFPPPFCFLFSTPYISTVELSPCCILGSGFLGSKNIQELQGLPNVGGHPDCPSLSHFKNVTSLWSACFEVENWSRVFSLYCLHSKMRKKGHD